MAAGQISAFQYANRQCSSEGRRAYSTRAYEYVYRRPEMLEKQLTKELGNNFHANESEEERWSRPKPYWALIWRPKQGRQVENYIHICIYLYDLEDQNLKGKK